MLRRFDALTIAARASVRALERALCNGCDDVLLRIGLRFPALEPQRKLLLALEGEFGRVRRRARNGTNLHFGWLLVFQELDARDVRERGFLQTEERCEARVEQALVALEAWVVHDVRDGRVAHCGEAGLRHQRRLELSAEVEQHVLEQERDRRFVFDDLDGMVGGLGRVLALDRHAVRERAVERFGVDRMVDGYAAVYERIARGRGRPGA